MKWYMYIICAVLIVVGVFCSVELVKVFSVESAEYGNIITFESKNNYEEVSKFDYDTIEFESDDYKKFISVTTYEATNFDGTMQNYILTFNGQPLNNIEVSAGKISGDFNLTFYNLDGNAITTVNVNFLVEYLASTTKVTIVTNNINNSISYFNAYMEINGAVLKVLIKE